MSSLHYCSTALEDALKQVEYHPLKGYTWTSEKKTGDEMDVDSAQGKKEKDTALDSLQVFASAEQAKRVFEFQKDVDSLIQDMFPPDR